MVNRILLLSALAGAETLKIVLAQAEIIPPGFWDVAKDFPILVLFLGSLYYLMRWGERMLEAQRLALKEVYDSNQIFLSALLTQIEAKQNKMIEKTEKLDDNVQLMGATLGEAMSVKDVIDSLLERIHNQ